MRIRFDRSLLLGLGNGLLFCVMTQWPGRALSATPLPVPCLPGTCGTNASGFVTSGAATAVQAGNNLTVHQASNTATLNWSSFNIGANGTVTFNQPTSASIALNRIFDANPTSIFGSLTANGQIYLINANGFLFGSGSKVNVAGMLASSLNLSDATFASGILAPLTSGLPALQAFTDSSGNVLSKPIVIDTGATLSAAANGRLLIAAPSVTNGGILNAPDGQIVLAAGQKVYLQASGSEDLRGLIVEVDGGGTVANQLSGALSAPRGNITLAGLMVNQDGRVSATTSVSANGSITLVAGTGNPSGGTGSLTPTVGGTVEMGPGSVTEVLPEYADTTTAVDAQTQLQSSVNITGQQVLMHGASIDAPSGVLTVLAAADPATGVSLAGNSQSQIRIDAGTSIDLAGSDADLPMAANLVSVQLRSNEFADDPTQRNGALRGQTVIVDVRADGGKGTPIADVSSAIAAVGRTIAQRTETGGTATFKSEGDVVFNPQASIDVSGGHTTYEGGTVQTTSLVGANGQLYDIGTANPLVTYSGVVNPTLTQTYDKWGVSEVVPTPGLSHFESTYVQGAAAGSVQFAAPNLVVDGTLKGSAVSGPYQRGPVGTSFGDAVAGGTLIIGVPGGLVTPDGTPDLLAPAIVLTSNPLPIVVADGSALPSLSLQLPTAYLTSDGFTGIQLNSNSGIALPAGQGLQLAAGASLSMTAPRIDVDSSIASVGGTLSFTSVLTADSATASRLGVGIGEGVSLDVSGQWTNDDILADGTGANPTLQNAGSILVKLTAPAGELVLGDGMTLKADGGAWLTNSGSLTYGTGGGITLDASPSQSALQLGQGTVVQAFGAGTAAGGSFSLSAPRIQISAGNGLEWTTAQRVDDLNPAGQVLNVYAPLFSNDGFSSITLTATGAVVPALNTDALSVAAGTTILAQAQSLQLNAGYATIGSGGTLDALAHTATLPAYARQPVSVTLNVLREADDASLGNTDFGNLDVQAGASIIADPGAAIRLTSEGSVLIGGTLRALGGTVTASIVSPGDVDPNSAGTSDHGYVAAQRIDLAPTAVIDVSGASIMTPNTAGLLQGTVSSGGAVSLLANRGVVVTEAGSVIDIAGTSASLDIANSAPLGGYTRSLVASAGGSLVVSSGQSISLLGQLNGAAGVGSSGAAAAGSLELDLVRSDVAPPPGVPALPGSALEIELVNSTTGATPSPSDSNLAVLGVQQIAASGIDALTLRVGGAAATGNILIDAGQLSLARSVVLDSPSITVTSNASLSAPYIAIGNSQVEGKSALVPTPVAGDGMLSVSAQQINLYGNFAIQGAAAATFTSSGDLQLQGTDTNIIGPITGELLTSGNLTLNSARVYPDTYTEFTLTAQRAGSTLSIGQTTASPGTPLSAAGALSVSADNIVVAGTVFAPFGSIALQANDTLTLANGSLLSVSGAGVDVPFGQTQLNGAQWVYQVPGGAANSITGTPPKLVTLSAPNLSVQKGATVDVQGGGNLYAYEFVPGTGGSLDALAQGTVAGLYAIIPGAVGQAAPYDVQESGTANQSQTVYLSGGAGIAAGYYALLPARYALEPGAVLIQLESSYVSANGGQIGQLANGTPVVAGYLSSGSTGLHSGLTDYQGFAVYPNGYAQQLANYTISNASSYFAALAAAAGSGAVAEPADAGTLNLTVTQAANNALSLEGSVLTAAASGGRGAQINLSAPDLEVTSGSGGGSAGSITVSGSVLQGWSAGSLTLGGVATATGDNTTGIVVGANSVTIDAGVQLTADQIDLVALQSIDVKSGATLASTSGAAGKVLSTLPVVNELTLTDAAGGAAPQAAFLSVSDLSLGVVSHPTASATTSATAATLTVESGSSLSSGGAFSFDAPGVVALSGTLSGKGASWSLGSGSISFEAGTGSADSLNIDTALLASLQQAGSVRLASQSSIDIDAPLSLGVSAGTPALSSLTLIGSSINNLSGGNVSFGAANLILAGNVAPDPLNPVSAASAGTGVLTLVANTLTVGSGVVSVNGFGQTTAQVAGALQTQGAGYLNVGGNLTLNAAVLNPAPDAQSAAVVNPALNATDETGTTLLASGLLTIGASTAGTAGSMLPILVGGNLTLSGAAIEDAGAIAAPSGNVQLVTAGNLHLAATASIDTSGAVLQAVDQSVASPGGIVVLNAGGNLSLDAGSALSVAGSATAPAGSMTLIGAGNLTLAGALNGGSALTGGNLSIDTGQLTGGLMGLIDLPAAGGAGLASFSNSIDVRVRGGSLDLAAGNAITSTTLMLTADSGAIDIAGSLLAPSAAQRGSIVLSGGTAVTLESGGQLLANGSGVAGRGGEIDIDSTCPTCAITLQNGSIVSAFGAAQMGDLVLRAPATANNDVAINVGAQGLGADVSRAGQVIIEPVLVFHENSSSIGANLGADVNTASGILSAAMPVIAARLNTASATPVNVQAGVEIQDADASDVLVLPSLDLAAFSTAGQVIDIAVRAAGALTVAGNISDGYVAGPISSSAALTTTPSATFSFVAGADLASAGLTTVRAGSGASLTLGSDGGGVFVRTGTGDIDLAAAADVVFTSGSSVFTAGTQAAAPVISKVGATKSSISFASGGGNVLVAAGGDVVGSQVVGDNGNYSVTGWQPRVGNSKVPAQYGNDLTAFDWNLGALGGGDVTVLAGGQVNNLSAAVADSLASTSVSGTAVSTLFGAGGGLRIAAGGDIGSAQVYVANGVGTLTTGGGLTAIVPNGNNTGNVGSSFALGNSQLSVWARQSVSVNAIYNPTAVSSQGFTNGQYFTYGSNSAVSLSSTGGNVTLDLDTDQSVMGALLGVAFIGQTGSNSGLTDLPASLSLRSLQQDVGVYAAGSILFPASTGQLVLFAGRDILSNQGELAMSDSFAGSYPTAAAPGVTLLNTGTSLGGLEPFAGNIHLGDPNPALITAGRDIVDLEVAVPKAALVAAGRDILNLSYQGQNTAVGDTTVISAGRDIEYNEQTTGQIQVGGPSSVNIFAGRNLDLGLSSGITTIGNLGNANLPSASGADLTLAVGYGTQGADDTGFLNTIIAPSATYQAQLIAYVEAQNGSSGLTYAQAQTAFLALPASRQQTLINSVFFNELLLSGRAANAGTAVGFAEGYAAIDALFPNSRTTTATTTDPYAGNLNLTLSQIYTLSGGNISIVVPGGGIDVGLAHAPSTLTPKPPSSLGIVAEGAGNVEIYSKGDVNVNASRIFTLGGGNILIWSDEGSIDAGNGSKSSLSVPPPVVQIAANGTITLDYGASLAAGSGIRTIQTGTGTIAGDVDLDAPVGTVNAGDAGIGSSGNINIAAAHVVGVDNINFGGTATGVPSDLSGLGASLSGVAAVAASATTNATSSVGESTAAKDAAPLAQTALSWLDVFVTGLGEENCRPDDLECLKRQKSAVP